MSAEYILYVLIVAGLVIACGVAIRAARPLPARKSQADRVHGKGSLQAVEPNRAPGPHGRPAPWGWPRVNCGSRNDEAGGEPVNGASATLHRWADQLIVEKKTKENQDYQARRDASIKALLEDRFCSQRRSSPSDRPLERNNGLGDRRSLEDLRTPWGW